MKTIGVVGGGIMGSGIAQAAAQSKLNVVLVEVSSTLCLKALERIDKQLNRSIQKKAIRKKDKASTLNRITFTPDLLDLKKAALVIEAVPEKLKIKEKLFRALDCLLPEKTILASNTSSISIKSLAAATTRPTKVIGMHFMNPVPVMPLVEIVVSQKTSRTTVQAIQKLAKKMGKTTVVAKDKPGFISNRILVPMINEAILCLQEGIGTKEGIDTVMKLGMHHPMGPLELADFIGLDTLLEIQQILHKGFKNPKYKPAKLLVEMVHAGKLGKKTGIGFYRYNNNREE